MLLLELARIIAMGYSLVQLPQSLGSVSIRVVEIVKTVRPEPVEGSLSKYRIHRNPPKKKRYPAPMLQSRYDGYCPLPLVTDVIIEDTQECLDDVDMLSGGA